jgi:hypothetical protein
LVRKRKIKLERKTAPKITISWLSRKTLVRMQAPTKAAMDTYSTIFRKDNICGLDETVLEISVWFVSAEVVIAL